MISARQRLHARPPHRRHPRLQPGSGLDQCDRNGNQLSAGARTFAWDLANRLKSTTLAGTTTTYAYDGEGKRLQASTGSQASQKTNFLWDPSFPLAQLVAEADGAGAALRRYRHGHRPLHVTAGSSVSYFHYDPLGSIVDVTAASGGGGLRWSYGFEPFGLTRTEQQYGTGQPVNLLKFTGEYLDPSGLYHLRARQYEPGSGRFLTRDPVAPSLSTPHVSLYPYVMNQPTVFVDPSGRSLGDVVDCVSDPLACGGDVVHGVLDATGLAAEWEELRERRQRALTVALGGTPPPLPETRPWCKSSEEKAVSTAIVILGVAVVAAGIYSFRRLPRPPASASNLDDFIHILGGRALKLWPIPFGSGMTGLGIACLRR